jgi:hypothetical protein
MITRSSFTYRFKVSATNEGYERSQEYKHRDTPNEIIHTFHTEVEKIIECDEGTFVIKREDIRFRQPITLKKNIDVLHYQLRKIVSNYLNRCGVDKQDTCIVEYELLRKNIFSKNEFISDNFSDEIGFMVNAIKAIGDNTLISPNKEIAAMHFEIPLNYVSSEIFYKLNVRATSDSPKFAYDYLKDFIAAFFRLIPKDVIEKYDTLYEKREKLRRKVVRDKESGEIRMGISPDERANYGGQAFALVSRLIRKDLIREIGYIIHCVHNGQKFCFESFASWKKAVIVFLTIDEKLTKYEDSNTPSSILNEISNKRHITDVEGFLFIIDKYYHIRKIDNGANVSAIFYKFLTECPAKYLNEKYKRGDKEYNKMEFKNLCLRYFGLEPNQYKPCKCEDFLLNSYEENLNVWWKIKPQNKD